MRENEILEVRYPIPSSSAFAVGEENSIEISILWIITRHSTNLECAYIEKLF